MQVSENRVKPETELGLLDSSTNTNVDSSVKIERPHLLPQRIRNAHDQYIRDLNDPGAGLSYPKQVLASETITNSILTPFDYSTIIQTLQNPINLNEIITVQIVRQNVRPLDQSQPFQNLSNPLQINPFQTCPKNHRIKFLTSHCDDQSQTSYGSCTACKQDLKATSYWRCEECIDQQPVFGICSDCYSKNFVRRHLIKKTDQHHYYQSFVIGPDRDASSSMQDRPKSFLEKEAENRASDLDGVAHAIAQVDVKCAQDAMVYALIGFWQSKPDGMVCYRQFRVDNPVYLSKDRVTNENGTLQMEQFLHYSQDRKDLFMMTRDQVMTMTVLDLDKCCKGEGLVEYTPNLYRVPAKQQYIFKDRCLELLNLYYCFDRTDPYVMPIRTSPSYVNSLLILKLDEQIYGSEIVSDTCENVFVIDLTSMRVKYLLKNVRYVLRLNEEEKTVWTIHDESICKLKLIDFQEFPAGQLQNVVVNAFALKQTLKINFESQTVRGEAQANLHNKDSRVTIVFPNHDWYTFELQNWDAVQIMKHNQITDATFVRKKDALFIAGNLTKADAVTHAQSRLCKSYKQWLFNVYDLNRADTDYVTKTKSNKNQNSLVYAIKVYCEMQDLGNRANQYQMTVLESSSDDLLPVIMQYVGNDKVRQEICSVIALIESLAEQHGEVRQKYKNSWPQVIEQSNYFVQYPLLMYVSSLPMRNMLIVANLTQNVPQINLNIYPYQFVCFVSKGLGNPAYLCEPGETTILFLAHHKDKEKRDGVRLMYYRTSAWRQDEDEDSDFPLSNQNNIMMIGGKIKLSEDLTCFPIKSAVLIQKRHHQESRMSLIMQYHSNRKSIVACSFDGENPTVLGNSDQEIQPCTMICGAQNDAYFVQFDSTAGYQIVQVKFAINKSAKNHKSLLTTTIIHQQRTPILVIQMKNMQPSYEPQNSQLLILDANKKYTWLSPPTQTALQGTQQSTNFVVSLVSDLQSSCDDLIDQLWHQQFPSIVLGSEHIIIKNTVENKQWKLQRSGFSLKTNFKYNYDFLEFQAGQDTSEQSTVMDISQINWIAKNITAVKEGKITYFLTQKSPGITRVDLMSNADMKDFVTQVKILDKVILVQTKKDLCFIFDQRTLLLKSKIRQTKSSVLTSIHDGVQYVKHLHQCQQDNEIKTTTKILKYYSDGRAPIIVRAEHQDQMNQIQKQIDEELAFNSLQTCEKYWLAPKMSKNGRFVQICVLKQRQEDKVSQKGFISVKKCVQFFDTDGLPIHDELKQNDENAWDTYILVGDVLKPFFGVETLDWTFTLTVDYLVLACFDQIVCLKLQSIKTKSSFNFQLWSELKPLIIDVKSLFDKDNLEMGIIVSEVRQQGIEFQQEGQAQSDNIIQITLSQYSLIWDIGANKEVSTLAGYDQFLTVDTFVRTGHALSQKYQKNGKQKFKPVLHDYKYNLFCLPGIEQDQTVSRIFRLFSELNLREMILFDEKFSQNETVTIQNLHFVLSDVFSVTMLQYFINEPRFASLVLEKFVSQTLEPQITSRGVEYDHIAVRSLYQILKAPEMPTESRSSVLYRFHAVYDNSAPLNSLTEVLQEPLHYQESQTMFEKLLKETIPNVPMLESLIGLLLLSRESSLSNVISKFADFEKLANISSVQIDKFFQNPFMRTEMTKAITLMQWTVGEKYKIIGSNTAQYSENTIQTNLEKQKLVNYSKILEFLTVSVFRAPKVKQQPVEVRIIEVEWINNKIPDLYKYLAINQDPVVFNTQLVNVLLMDQEYGYEIIFYAFLPFLAYMISVLTYFTDIMVQSEYTRDPSWFKGPQSHVFCRSFIMIFTIVLMYIEFKQIMFYRRQYTADLWNLIQVGNYILIFTVVYYHSCGLEYQVLQITRATSIGALVLWLMVFSWMRLFSGTSFLVLIIIEALYDIRYFFIMVCLCLCMFGNAFLILDDKQIQMSRESGDEYQQIIPVVTWWRFCDSILNQYLIGLGNIDTSNYPTNSTLGLLWAYMILTTVITQLVFVNIFVAIISDTYSRITERRILYALMQKTKLYADFIQIVRLNKNLRTYKYLYVVTPVQVSDEQEDWSGAINALKHQVTKILHTIEQSSALRNRQLHKEIERLQGQIDQVNDKQDLMYDVLQTIKKNVVADK